MYAIIFSNFHCFAGYIGWVEKWMLCQSSREAENSTYTSIYIMDKRAICFTIVPASTLHSWHPGPDLIWTLLHSSFVFTAPETMSDSQEPRLYNTGYTNQEAVKAVTILVILTASKGCACHGGMGDSIREFFLKDCAIKFQHSWDRRFWDLGAKCVEMSQMIPPTQKLFSSNQSLVR